MGWERASLQDWGPCAVNCDDAYRVVRNWADLGGCLVVCLGAQMYDCINRRSLSRSNLTDR